MPTNDFLEIATGGGANVETQVAYAADADRTAFFPDGAVPDASQHGKMFRQVSVIAAMIAQAICDITGKDMLDDGNAAAQLANFKTLLGMATTQSMVAGAGTANALTIAPTNGAAAYKNGETWFIHPTTTNTSNAVTLNRNGIGAKTILDPTGNSLAPGAITSGGMIQVTYNLAADRFYLVTTANSIASLIQSPSGYFRIPGTQVLIQWIRYSLTTSRTNNTPSGTMWEVQVNVSWPIAMTTLLFAWAACDITNNGNFEFANIVGNATTFDVYATSWADAAVGQPNHGWAVAIGYAS